MGLQLVHRPYKETVKHPSLCIEIITNKSRQNPSFLQRYPIILTKTNGMTLIQLHNLSPCNVRIFLLGSGRKVFNGASWQIVEGASENMPWRGKELPLEEHPPLNNGISNISSFYFLQVGDNKSFAFYRLP